MGVVAAVASTGCGASKPREVRATQAEPSGCVIRVYFASRMVTGRAATRDEVRAVRERIASSSKVRTYAFVSKELGLERMAKKQPGLTQDLRYTVWHTLDRFVHQMGVTSFNLVIYMPPLAAADEDWSGFPHIVRIVDRGEATNKTADVGAMELYASSVVSSDPFRLAAALR